MLSTVNLFALTHLDVDCKFDWRTCLFQMEEFVPVFSGIWSACHDCDDLLHGANEIAQQIR